MGLENKIEDRSAAVGVLGLGYVGLPLVATIAKAGFQVTGFDTNNQKVDSVNAGHSYIADLPSEGLSELVKSDRVSASTNMQSLAEIDVICICVPTPLSKTKTPDISSIIAAAHSIAEYSRPNQLIVLESTTYPGTTREVLLPLLEAVGLKVGYDFFLAFSAERVDPGNTIYHTGNTPKVVGGITDNCKSMTTLFYKKFVDEVHQVSSASAAESVKLLENTFRAVNIALVNEFSQMCDKMGLDVWEIVDAAATKPFGYMPFYPGPGLGGHCIPIDPHYLAWKSRLHGHSPRFIDLASEINSAMPSYVVNKIANRLNQDRLAINGSFLLVIGVSYKPDVADTRESPAIEVINQLAERGANVCYHDPLVHEVNTEHGLYRSQSLNTQDLKNVDCIVVLTNHSSIDYEKIKKYMHKVIDTRDSFTK